MTSEVARQRLKATQQATTAWSRTPTTSSLWWPVEGFDFFVFNIRWMPKRASPVLEALYVVNLATTGAQVTCFAAGGLSCRGRSIPAGSRRR